MPRSPFKLENQYSQLLQSMIMARQKNTSYQELQNKIHYKFPVYNQFSSNSNKQPMRQSYEQQRRFDVSPDRQINQGNQFHLRRNFNHRSKINQSEIVRGLSRPNSSNNSQQHFNTLTTNNSKAVCDLVSLNKSEQYLSFQQNNRPLSTSMQAQKYDSAQTKNQSREINSDIQKKNRSQGGIELKKKLLNEILRGTQSNLSTRQLISTLKEKINGPKFQTNQTVDHPAIEQTNKTKMMSSFVLQTNSTSPTQLKHKPYISPYHLQVNNTHKHSSYAQLLSQMRQSPTQTQQIPQERLQYLQQSILKEPIEPIKNTQYSSDHHSTQASNIGLQKSNTQSSSDLNKYSHYSVLHTSFKQELGLMKCQDLNAENFMTFLFNLENREQSFNRQFYKNDFRESMFGDIRVLAQTIIKRIQNDISTIKTNLEVKVKDNQQLIEMNIKLHNNHNNHSETHKIQGRTQLKGEHLNELFIKNKQLTQIVQKQQILLKQSQDKEEMLTRLVERGRKNSESDIQETQKRAYEKNEGLDHIDSHHRRVSFLQQSTLQKDESLDKKYKNASSSSSLSSMNLIEVPSHQSNLQEKGGLKLNLGSIKLDPSTGQQPIGYHEEFMARINEFSESWRQAALQEKRF